MKEFEKEGIKFSLPTRMNHLAQDDYRPLQISIAEDTQHTA